MKLTEEWIQQLLDDQVAGTELVVLEVAGNRRQRVVRLYIDHPDGVTHESCARVSVVVSEALDATDWSEGPYTLEVSSPGLERPLRKPAHFQAQIGKEVYVKAFGPVSGRKVWRGTLLDVTQDGIVVREGGEEAFVRFEQIAQAHVIYEF